MYQHFEDCILIWSIDVHVHICNPDLYKITYSIIMCFKVTISWSSSTHARTHTLAHKCSKLTEKRVYGLLCSLCHCSHLNRLIGVDLYGSILAEPEELNETSVSVYQVQYGNGPGVYVY